MGPGNPAGWLLHLAGLATVFTLYRRDARRIGLPPDVSLLVAAAAVTGGVLGALLANAAVWLPTHWEEWVARSWEWRLAAILTSGRTWIGAVAGGWALVEFAKRRLGYRRSTGDAFAPGLAFGEAVGRIGCFMNACCYGRPAELPWSVVQHDALRHPAQLYSAAGALLLGVLLLRLRPAMPREGDLFRVYLLGAAGLRFGLEFVRENQAAGLSPAQWACLAVLAYLTARWLPGFAAALRA